MKRFFVLFLVLALVCSLLCIPVFASESDSVIYELSVGTSIFDGRIAPGDYLIWIVHTEYFWFAPEFTIPDELSYITDSTLDGYLNDGTYYFYSFECSFEYDSITDTTLVTFTSLGDDLSSAYIALTSFDYEFEDLPLSSFYLFHNFTDKISLTADNVIGTISSVLPITLLVAGGILVVFICWKLFKKFTRG